MPKGKQLREGKRAYLLYFYQVSFHQRVCLYSSPRPFSAPLYLLSPSWLKESIPPICRLFFLSPLIRAKVWSHKCNIRRTTEGGERVINRPNLILLTKGDDIYIYIPTPLILSCAVEQAAASKKRSEKLVDSLKAILEESDLRIAGKVCGALTH